jgi:EmrB/QacA subfamily drug resistance transporter
VAISPGQIHTILASLILVMFMGSVEQAIVSPALPVIAGYFHQVTGISWVVTAYLLCATPGTLVVGKLSDILGRRRVMMASLVVFFAGSLICAAAPSLVWLIVGRLVQGAGGAGLISLPNAIVGDIVSPRERGKYQVYISGTYGMAGLAGPICGGLLTTFFSWRAVFWAFLPLTVFAMVFVSRTLRVLPIPRIRSGFDYLGAVLMTSSMACLLIAIQQGHSVDWTPVFWLVAVVLGGAFVIRELRIQQPLLPMRLFQDRIVVATSVGGFLVVATIASFAAYLPILYELGYGLSTSEAGFVLAFPLVGVVIGNYVGGQYMRRTGRYRLPPIWGSAIAAVVSVTMAALAVTANLPTVVALTSIEAIGAGTCLPPMLVAVQNAMHGREMGVATSLQICSRALGGMTGVAVLGTIVLSALSTSIGAAVGSDALQLLSASKGSVSLAFSLFFLGNGAIFATAFAVLLLLFKEREFRPHAASIEAALANAD